MKVEEIVVLGRAGDHQALGSAIPGLPVKERRIAIQELGKLGARSAAGALTRVATSDPDQVCRLAAARGLKRIGGPAGEAGLIAALKTESDDTVTHWILKGLKNVGSKRVIPSLPSAANSKNSSVRAEVVSVIGAIGLTDESTAILLGMLDDRDFTVRFLAIGELEFNGSPTAQAAARERMKQENLFVRCLFWAKRTAERRGAEKED